MGQGAPTGWIDGCRAAHAALLADLGGLTDAQARGPCALPDWTVGHLLTHIARNGDSVVRRLEGALRGEVLDQYVGGQAGRADEIAAPPPPWCPTSPRHQRPWRRPWPPCPTMPGTPPRGR